MKVFLAGDTGFFATYLFRVLPGEGHTLTILARPGTDTDSLGNADSIIKGDPTREGIGRSLLRDMMRSSIFPALPFFSDGQKRLNPLTQPSTFFALPNLCTAKNG